MSPYIFRYHNTDFDNEYSDGNRDYHNRHKRYSYTELKPRNDYDNSLYGETVYDYESDYTERAYRNVLSKRYYDNSNHSRGSQHHGHRHSNGYHDRLVQHTTPKSEPPVKFGFHGQDKQLDMWRLRMNNRGQHTEPRVTLMDKRLQNDKHLHCNCHACPEKSSKTIPTMHYDELRCPYCAAYVQPSQDEIIAYPWTAQTYRPKRRAGREESLPPERSSNTATSIAQASTPSQLQSTTHSNHQFSTNTKDTPHGKKSDNSIEQNTSTVVPPKPLFRHMNNNITRSGTRSNYSQYFKQSSVAKRQSAMSTINEGNDFDDDIKASDSISNISLPVLRAQPTDLLPNRNTETRIDKSYTRDKYFDSLENKMPRPQRDTASHISRMLKGEYYDRRNNQKYMYSVNYAPGNVNSVRIPKS